MESQRSHFRLLRRPATVGFRGPARAGLKRNLFDFRPLFRLTPSLSAGPVGIEGFFRWKKRFLFFSKKCEKVGLNPGGIHSHHRSPFIHPMESPADISLKNLLEELKPQLLRYAQSMGLSAHDAEDAVQDGLIAMSQRIDQDAASIRNPKAYAFTVVRNNAFQKFRQQSRRNEVELTEDHQQEGETPPDAIEEPALAEAFRKAFTSLTKMQRQLIQKRYFEQMTLDEIGAELGCTPQNAWKLLKKTTSVVLKGEVRVALTEIDPDLANELFNTRSHGR